jgi:hypothetical protein
MLLYYHVDRQSRIPDLIAPATVPLSVRSEVHVPGTGNLHTTLLQRHCGPGQGGPEVAGYGLRLWTRASTIGKIPIQLPSLPLIYSGH